MSKGTPSFGKHQKAMHLPCRRCGRHSYHRVKKRCSACGYGATSRIRRFNWQRKQFNRIRLW
ncbi:MAG: 50S ribosomal protein L37e [Candidatus Undinarchaeales archaeon]|nr:50S ribosomal protein L37e [Candidatus Undinarchaeales archaeon]MDP7492441.1 50S ribosomal protein L37e [Candidatus Undinarchaeales archaeon]